MSAAVIDRRRLPQERIGTTVKLEIETQNMGRQEGYVIFNVYPDDGTLGEIFLHGFAKEGSTFDGWMQAVSLLFSVGIQSGVNFHSIARKLVEIRFDPFGRVVSDPEIKWCNSVLGYVVHRIAKNLGYDELAEELDRIVLDAALT